MRDTNPLPILIVGAGPIGLAAAAHLTERGLPFRLLEAGAAVGVNLREWSHVRLFTPWSYLIDAATERLLTASRDWEPPEAAQVPYARDVLERYLEPLSRLEAVRPHIHLNHEVVSITREGHDKMKDGQRDAAPFLVMARTPNGMRRYMASAVLDASGTWSTPNPMGAGGVWADGERDNHEHIRYGIPDMLGDERERYQGKRILIVGSGHSAIGSVLSAAALVERAPGTQVAWAIRSREPGKLWGGGARDELQERGALGTRVHDAVHSGAVHLLTGLSIGAVRMSSSGLEIVDVEGEAHLCVDEVIVATGSRPSLDMLRELRVTFDVTTEAAGSIGPMIDPNHHSCGSVPPHGAMELRHPEAGFFILGMKSYGRAPTFLLRTGYEQVRSVAAYLAGDLESAQSAEWTLPQTGVCSTELAFEASSSETSSCC